jgi:hypothetical protein
VRCHPEETHGVNQMLVAEAVAAGMKAELEALACVVQGEVAVEPGPHLAIDRPVAAGLGEERDRVQDIGGFRLQAQRR